MSLRSLRVELLISIALLPALRSRMGTMVPTWVHYMELTALNG